MPIVLTQEIKDMINGGLTTGNPMLLAVVAGDKPVLSFRGSTQVYSDSALGLWIRAGSGTTLEAIKANPNVALMYRSATTPFLQFQGRARIAADEAERKTIFENAPEFEQSRDTARTGTALVIDLEKVEGVLRFGANGPEFVKMER
ncbi:MAG TPA: pyridoxamine 5'-phosphate oxidase family protein [Rhizomicrobium sp.]|nr:pyridoxamine 5'-phosphate oxidase family protein [Rhizomicrobium sp.]